VSTLTGETSKADLGDAHWEMSPNLLGGVRARSMTRCRRNGRRSLMRHVGECGHVYEGW